MATKLTHESSHNASAAFAITAHFTDWYTIDALQSRQLWAIW